MMWLSARVEYGPRQLNIQATVVGPIEEANSKQGAEVPCAVPPTSKSILNLTVTHVFGSPAHSPTHPCLGSRNCRLDWTVVSLLPRALVVGIQVKVGILTSVQPKKFGEPLRASTHWASRPQNPASAETNQAVYDAIPGR